MIIREKFSKLHCLVWGFYVSVLILPYLYLFFVIYLSNFLMHTSWGQQKCSLHYLPPPHPLPSLNWKCWKIYNPYYIIFTLHDLLVLCFSWFHVVLSRTLRLTYTHGRYPFNFHYTVLVWYKFHNRPEARNVLIESALDTDSEVGSPHTHLVLKTNNICNFV